MANSHILLYLLHVSTLWKHLLILDVNICHVHNIYVWLKILQLHCNNIFYRKTMLFCYSVLEEWWMIDDALNDWRRFEVEFDAEIRLTRNTFVKCAKSSRNHQPIVFSFYTFDKSGVTSVLQRDYWAIGMQAT